MLKELKLNNKKNYKKLGLTNLKFIRFASLPYVTFNENREFG